MTPKTTEEFSLPDELVLSEVSASLEVYEVSASLEVLVSPDESPDEDDPPSPPPPPPPPPQEITRILIINTIIDKIGFFIFFTLILREISSSRC